MKEENKQLIAEAKQATTPGKLAAFTHKLNTTDDLDPAVAAVAAMTAAFATVQAGRRHWLTSEQRMLAGWWAVHEFMGVEGHARVVQFGHMLHNSNADEFTMISQVAFEDLQEQAADVLEHVEDLETADRDHLTSIVEGVVPFGYTLS